MSKETIGISEQLDRIAISGNNDAEYLDTTDPVLHSRYIELVKLRREAVLVESRINISLIRVLYRRLMQS